MTPAPQALTLLALLVQIIELQTNTYEADTAADMALARAVLAAVCRQRDMLEAAAAGPSANGKDDVYVSPRAGVSIVL
jgi:hypothetical protein